MPNCTRNHHAVQVRLYHTSPILWKAQDAKDLAGDAKDMEKPENREEAADFVKQTAKETLQDAPKQVKLTAALADWLGRTVSTNVALAVISVSYTLGCFYVITTSLAPYTPLFQDMYAEKCRKEREERTGKPEPPKEKKS